MECIVGEDFLIFGIGLILAADSGNAFGIGDEKHNFLRLCGKRS